MALGFIKKVFSFGKDKAETDDRPQEDAAPERGNENASFEAALSDAEAQGPVDKDPVSELEMETAGGPAPDEATDAVLSADDEEEDAPLLPGAELSGDMGVVPLSLLQAEAAAEEQAESGAEAADVVLDVDAMDALLEEAEAATDAEPSATLPALPKGFSSASERQEPAPVAPQVKLTWFQRLRAGLARTSSQLTTQISALFTKRKLDEDTLDELEDLLIQSDLGVETAMRITGALSSERYGKDVSGEDVARIMAGEITKVLKPVAKPLELDLSHKPHVILVVGVNGTGKTTTIGKLAAKLAGSGLKVMLAAGDTFRAAAIEQLKIWADRTGSQFIGTKLGADAAGLAYDAYEQARAQKSDVLIIDTAGRLQNKTELMAELEKIVRVLGKLDPDAPHTVLQTLDATTGQNAMNQVEIFRNVAGVSGLIMTKLDGTARGGILVAIAAKHKLPVYFIGVGEGVDDLEPFEAEDFARAIAGV
ncbi:signal recognition particle-docking protein FtsY [Agrobacterium tumefaciens]|uniref:signal recognition particle-docking protein FtsY n=1 Tax=Agrobacterium tumefaciens TaxID=358 RepID=UPI0015748CF9|nr:signal recognition particle-docking protein FtsY [Agrobacterium tumefaciens]NTB95354.1 signal recognition particle-docking protein FtsY [Agrobacterium tumefaciens]NTC45219.1 signal recognition particle-docking protein FtsY [Agrobacterium tumefaciens]